MKRIFSILLIIAAALGVSASAKSERISPDQVPASLTSFVTSNFGKDVKIVAAEREHKLTGYEYEVTLSNGAEIDYASGNEWIEVESKTGAVPSSIVGDEIFTHVNVAYPQATIKKIERESYGYKVKLNNGISLRYNKAHKYIGVDK